MGDKPLSHSNQICVGTIVEFMQDNIPQIAWVMEKQSEKIRLMLPNRRESNLSSPRLLPWYGPLYSGTKSKDEIAQLLQEHKEKRKSLQDKIDILALWEMTQGEVNQESASFFAELVESEPTHDDIAAFAHALLNKKSHFKFQNPNFEVYKQEAVDNKLEAEKIAAEREVLIGSGANWFNYLWELHQKGHVYNPSDNISGNRSNNAAPEEPILSRLKNLLLNRIVDPESQDDDVLWKQIIKQLPDDNHIPLLLATAWGLVPEHYNFWLARADYDSNPDFAIEHTSYLENICALIHDLQNMGTQNTTNTIDSIGTLRQHTVNNDANVPDSTEQDCDIKSPLSIKNQDYKPIKNFFSPYFNRDFISIDSAQTKDIDDAFTLSKDADGNYDIHIALACPACAWEFNSPFDKLILQRISSLYLPEATYHMMPEILSTQAFSLKENQIKPALICYCKVSVNGETLSSNWDFARVSIKNNLHYNACEAILNENLALSHSDDTRGRPDNSTDSLDFLEHMDNIKSEDVQTNQVHAKLDDECPPCPQALVQSKSHEQTLLDAHEFAKTRLAWRINQGSVIIEKEDMRIRLENTNNEENKVQKSEKETGTQVFIEYIAQNPKAQLIVSELMILANEALANFAVAKNIPLLFRTQDLALPKEFAGIWKRPQDIAKVARSLSGAKTDTTAKPHAGLGLKAYSPVTSPLRRYGDLVNEAQLLHFLYTQKPLWNKEELDKLLFNFQMYNDVVSQVQRMRPRYWRFVYIQQEAKRQGEKCGFHAIVSDENDMYVTVTLSREQLIVRAKRNLFGDKALLGQEVYIRLGKINPLRGEMTILAVQDIS